VNSDMPLIRRLYRGSFRLLEVEAPRFTGHRAEGREAVAELVIATHGWGCAGEPALDARRKTTSKIRCPKIAKDPCLIRLPLCPWTRSWSEGGCGGNLFRCAAADRMARGQCLPGWRREWMGGRCRRSRYAARPASSEQGGGAPDTPPAAGPPTCRIPIDRCVVTPDRPPRRHRRRGGPSG